MKKIFIVGLMSLLTSTAAYALEFITCTGRVPGFVVNQPSPYAIKINIIQFNQNEYVLNYVGPSYELGDSGRNGGFTYLLKSHTSADLKLGVSTTVMTTSSSKRFIIENHNATLFVFELSKDQSIGHLMYSDAKPIGIKGELNCWKETL